MADLMQTIAGVGAAGIGLAGSAALLRRRLSRDKTEMVKDRAESTIVELLLKERDQARDEAQTALKTHHDDAQTIARLTVDSTYQSAEIARLVIEFAAYKRLMVRMYPETRTFIVSEFSDLDPLNNRPASVLRMGRRSTDAVVPPPIDDPQD